MQDKKPRHTPITSKRSRGRKLKHHRDSESVAGGVIPATSKTQQNPQLKNIFPYTAELRAAPLLGAHPGERRAFRALHRVFPFPGDPPAARSPPDPPEPPGAPVPSVALPASGAAAAPAPLSSRLRAAPRESGGARGALLPPGGLMPAWGAAFQRESLRREERGGGGSPAAVTAGCRGGPAPPAGLSRVERPKCAALSRGGRAEHTRVIVRSAVPPRPAPRPLTRAVGPSVPGQRRRPRALAPAAAQPAPGHPLYRRRACYK